MYVNYACDTYWVFYKQMYANDDVTADLNQLIKRNIIYDLGNNVYFLNSERSDYFREL